MSLLWRAAERLGIRGDAGKPAEEAAFYFAWSMKLVGSQNIRTALEKGHTIVPLALYFLLAGPSRDNTDFAGTGVAAPLYYMVGMAAFGAQCLRRPAGFDAR